MYKKRAVEVYASEIAEVLNLELKGEDFIVTAPGSLAEAKEGSVVYADTLTEDTVSALRGKGHVLLLVRSVKECKPELFSYIITPHPRLAFARVLHEFFVERDIRQIDPTVRIAPEARIGRNVTVGSHSIIGPDVVIGDNTLILNNVVISGPVVLGNNCVLKDGAVIGSEGYSFEFDEETKPVHVPYVGRIVIGDNVWLGANSTIERAEVEDTVIEPFVKIDDLVQIGQSCYIGQRSMIAAGTVVSAKVRLGCDCWLAPNVSVRDGIIIGDNVLVGIGAVVIKDLAANGVYVGNPARFLRAKERR